MDPFLLLLLGIVIVIGAIAWLRLPAFVALLLAAIAVAVLTPKENVERAVLAQGRTPVEAAGRANEPLGAKLAGRFGQTCANLGLLIATASIIGACLLRSGGADRIVQSILGLFGERRSPLVFATSGLVLGVPVFFDTVFLLLIPLARTMATRTARNYLLLVLAIIVGGTMTHSLVPPTPGPLFVATALGVDLGLMILAGLVLSIGTASIGLLYAYWANRRWPLVVRPPANSATPTSGLPAEPVARELPPLWLALAPIVIPVVLICGRTLGEGRMLALTPDWLRFFSNIGNQNIALAIGAAVALGTVAMRRGASRDAVRDTVQAALLDAGVIILITGAGGVFGGVLQETGIGERIQGMAREYRLGVLPLAFLITALMRTAQGSSTVAMVTGVGILGGFASPQTLGFHPVYVALAIGCGSKVVSWMNDSGFWVICKMSGMTEREALRSVSVMVGLMGFTGFVLIVVAAKVFPLI